MVIGDDEVEAEPLCGFSFGKSAHPGVDGDDETNTVSECRFKH